MRLHHEALGTDSRSAARPLYEATALAGSELPRARDDLPGGFETTAHALLDPLFVHLRETPAGENP